MKEKTLKDVFAVCLDLDRVAKSIYECFAGENLSPELTDFWHDVIRDETMHIRFWETVIRLSEHGDLFVIDNLQEKFRQLSRMKKNLASLLKAFQDYGSPYKELLLAYMIELYLFEPAFISIMQTVSSISSNISAQYGKHTMKFIRAMRQFGGMETRSEINVMEEILSNLYEMNRQLFKESVTDPLTGLLNRRGFFNMARPFLALSERNRQHSAVLMIDLDNFKRVNDKFGHPAGDRVLQDVSSLLRTSIRKSDVSGRYGGEEFVLLCHAVTRNKLEGLCERIRKNIEQKSGSKTGIPVTISVGAVISTTGDMELSDMIDVADVNLFAAKDAGRNCCRIQ